MSIALTLALLIYAAPATAKPKPITGKLSKKGLTVVALAQDGKATSVEASRGKFRLVPPAAKVTLQLRNSDGSYGGPIVVGGKGRSAVLGVKAGAKLGLVRVAGGYGKTAKPLAARFVNKSISAQAKKGIPIGASVFGRVSSSKKKASGGGRDQDLDGIPGAFDVDDDGDLLLDNFEGTTTANKTEVSASDTLPPPGSPPGPAPMPGPPGAGVGSSSFKIFSNLKAEMTRSLNANAGAVTDAQIDALMSSTATLAIQVAFGAAVELDCGGLSYCSSGGTGKTMEGNQPFPASADSDSDGWGTISAGSTGDFQLLPGSISSQIGSGDSFIEHVTDGGTETEIPGILNYIFSTTPALSQWTTNSGSGSVTYPVAEGAVGTQSNPIPVASGSDAVATLTLWRPQRKPISGSGESGDWIDIGHLMYTADIPNGPSSGGPGAPGSSGPGNCSATTYSSVDPSLTLAGEAPHDTADDRAADPANTLTFAVNLTQCLATRGITWTAGQTLGVDIQARSEFGDNAAQKLYFKM